MARLVGTVSRGIRTPIIRENDDIIKIVTDSVLEASKDEDFKRVTKPFIEAIAFLKGELK